MLKHRLQSLPKTSFVVFVQRHHRSLAQEQRTADAAAAAAAEVAHALASFQAATAPAAKPAAD